MAVINRHNVIDLIGRNPRKYHSCIITCFTFNFTYFEERILPVLRVSNIKNINIFVDGNELEKAQEFLSGKEFSFQKNYSLIPIYNNNGVFHPKVIYLFGHHEGLVTIGSGNLTSSGLSYNDEIWASFQHKDLQTEDLYVFKETWFYLNQFFDQAIGVGKEKLNWIYNNSAWLGELIHKKDISNAHLSVISSNFFREWKNELNDSVVQTITIISPFYDSNGKIIEELNHTYQPQSIRIVLDANSELLPFDFFDTQLKNIAFYDWRDVKKDFDDNYFRLHAKIFHFETAQEEYLFIGSPNATLAALGNESVGSINNELGILFKRKKKKSTWLDELGISFASKNQIKDFQYLLKNKPTEQNKLGGKNNKYPLKIKYAENTSSSIHVYLNTYLSDSIQLLGLDRNGLPVKLELIENGKAFVQLRSDRLSDVFKIYAFDGSNRISNYCIVHQVDALIKTNPNQRNAALDELMNNPQIQIDNLYKVVQFMDYSWTEETNENVQKSIKTVNYGNQIKSVNEPKNSKEEKVSYEEFNNVDNIYQRLGITNHANIRIADYFLALSKGLDNNYDESLELSIDDEIEIEDVQSEKQLGNKQSVPVNVGLKIKKHLEKFLLKVNQHLYDKIDNVLKFKIINPTDFSNDYYNLNLISKLSVASELLVQYRDITFEYENENFIHLIEQGNIDDHGSSIKGFLYNTIGLFMIGFNQKGLHYEYQYLNEKMVQYQEQLLKNLVYLTQSVYWRKSNTYQLELIYLNLRMYFKENRNIVKLLNGLVDIELEIHFNDWLINFENIQSRKELIVEANHYLIDKIIFNSKLGFCRVIGCKNQIVEVETLIGLTSIKLPKCILFK